MIFVNHVVELIVQRLDAVARDVANAVRRRLEERLEALSILLHAMMNVDLAPAAHLRMRLRIVDVEAYVGTVVFVALCELGLMLVILLLLLVLLLLLLNNGAVLRIRCVPHLEWRCMQRLGRVHR